MNQFNPLLSTNGTEPFFNPDKLEERASTSGSEDGSPYMKMLDVGHKTDEDMEDGDNNSLTSQTLNADGTPKRPMNAFMIFARRRRPQVSAENQSMRTGEISKILSKEWNSMPPAEKQFYLDRAKELKDTFNSKYPDYIYRRRPNNSRKRRRDSVNSRHEPSISDPDDLLGGPGHDLSESPIDREGAGSDSASIHSIPHSRPGSGAGGYPYSSEGYYHRHPAAATASSSHDRLPYSSADRLPHSIANSSSLAARISQPNLSYAYSSQGPSSSTSSPFSYQGGPEASGSGSSSAWAPNHPHHPRSMSSSWLPNDLPSISTASALVSGSSAHASPATAGSSWPSTGSATTGHSSSTDSNSASSNFFPTLTNPFNFSSSSSATGASSSSSSHSQRGSSHSPTSSISPHSTSSTLPQLHHPHPTNANSFSTRRSYDYGLPAYQLGGAGGSSQYGREDTHGGSPSSTSSSLPHFATRHSFSGSGISTASSAAASLPRAAVLPPISNISGYTTATSGSSSTSLSSSSSTQTLYGGSGGFGGLGGISSSGLGSLGGSTTHLGMGLSGLGAVGVGAGMGSTSGFWQKD